MNPKCKISSTRLSQMRANITKHHSSHNSSYKKAILSTTALVLGIIIIVHYMQEYIPFSWPFLMNDGSIFVSRNSATAKNLISKKCNIFRGTWVPYPKGPLYTNESKCFIADQQNCMKFGRPDTEFMKWRWKPDECELPLFDAAEFLELVKGKSMALVGDSVPRNQLQSLSCLLSSVASPIDKTDEKYPRFRKWFYPDYNFTLALVVTTHLVKSSGSNSSSAKPVELYLDEVEDDWTNKVKNFDYVIISAGHWFTRPLTYYEKNKVVGCSMCRTGNVTDLNKYYGYRKAFRTSFRALLDSRNFKGMVIMRTITPAHFEMEDSNGRGNCVRTRPYKKDEYKLDWNIWMFYLVQVEEFFMAQHEGKKRGLNFKLLDITEAMRTRADGHPNRYGYLPELRFTHQPDCLHWCLPGPIDTWNELLLQMLKTKAGEDVY